MSTPENPPPRLFGDVTDTDRIRWQLRAVTALQKVLTDAARDGLPVISWTLTLSGGLAGQVIPQGTTAQRRAAFELWCAHLHITPWPERTKTDSWVHLHAVGSLAPLLDLRVAVALAADLAPDDPYDPTTEEC